MENPELYKYKHYYNKPGKYGSSLHGKSFLNSLGENVESLLDVGCGQNEFVEKIREMGCEKAIGVDFACPKADQIADVTQGLPFEDKEFEYVTAFDVLEHLRPEQVDPALKEMERVSRKFCFTISLRDSWMRGPKGESLHPTVRPADWWGLKITKFGGSFTKKWTSGKTYLCIGRWAVNS